MSLIQHLLEKQAAFDAHDAQRLFAAHVEIPVVVISVYLVLVWYGPVFMAKRRPLKLRRVSQLWNFSVAMFSVGGTLATVPHLLRHLTTHGLWYSVCADAYELAGSGAPALWAALFTWSKLFELFDTVLLVARKRPLILLHWFHHASVIGFVWSSWIYVTPLALWYGAMNFSVHSLMYSYFLASSFDRRILHVAPFVTAMQIAQFAWGTVINSLAAVSWSSNSIGCAVHPSFLQIGVVMYLAYGALFVRLFLQRYLGTARSASRAAAQSECGELEALKVV
uniref:Elongation of fatty acids protein n=1 Tax=Calcidiscus leptoporus TaxID=127549 RepID=A0A7S0JG57_9EUKA|mmetsp:Transcript_56521/g.129803  ORF Transcript_56521/g.129803 Transcript_56521/m.129803 type:complete len:280 (+) Transcript_56521:296-1135(+)